MNAFVAYPALLVLAWMAWRGSLRAYLVWLGVLAYSAYSYLLYAGFLHFSGWFLVYVAVLGLSVYALIGGLVALPAERVAAAFSDRAPVRLAGGLLVALGLAFAALWLAEIVPSALAGEPLPSATEAGLVTNPVHILDLAILLPAMVLTGVQLRRGRPVGYLLVVPLYGFGIVMSAAILGMFASLAVAAEPVLVPVAVVMIVVAGVQVWVLARLLSTLSADVDVMAQLDRTPDRAATGR